MKNNKIKTICPIFFEKKFPGNLLVVNRTIKPVTGSLDCKRSRQGLLMYYLKSSLNNHQTFQERIFTCVANLSSGVIASSYVMATRRKTVHTYGNICPSTRAPRPSYSTQYGWTTAIARPYTWPRYVSNYSGHKGEIRSQFFRKFFDDGSGILSK